MLSQEDDFRALVAAEQRERRRNAVAFAEAAKHGDVERFARFAYPDDALNIDYALAFRRISKLNSVSRGIAESFVGAWVEHKMLPLSVGNRRVLANALRVLMPPRPGQEALTVYRGTTWRERTRRIYLFSWTRDRDVARRFANRWQVAAENLAEQGLAGADDFGIILQTTAPPDAIFLVRDPVGYYDEGEVVVDPFHLGVVSVVERLTHGRRP